MVRHQGNGQVREPYPEEKARAMGFPEGLLAGVRGSLEQRNQLVGNAIDLNTLTFIVLAMTQEEEPQEVVAARRAELWHERYVGDGLWLEEVAAMVEQAMQWELEAEE